MMKRFLSLLLVAVCFTSATFSQKTSFGIRAGMNLAKWKIGDIPSGYSTKMKSGIEAGLFAEYAISTVFSVQAEGLYAMYGTKLVYSGKAAIYKVDYIAIPVLAKYRLENALSFYAGPQIGILANARSEINGNKENFKSMVKGTDIFAVAGVDFSFPNGLMINARYNLGLTEFEKEAETTLKNRSFSFGVGYKLDRFFIKRK